MLSFTLYLFGLLMVGAAIALAAYHDMRAFRIPNYLSFLVIVGFVAAYGALQLAPVPEGASAPLGPFGSVLAHLLSGVLMFLLSLGLFASRLVGAGDAKFATTLALWFGSVSGLALYVFYVSLAGGVLGLLTLALKRFKPLPSFSHPESWVGSAQAGLNRVPYGVAISLGFVFAAHHMGMLDITGVASILENGG